MPTCRCFKISFLQLFLRLLPGPAPLSLSCLQPPPSPSLIPDSAAAQSASCCKLLPGYQTQAYSSPPSFYGNIFFGKIYPKLQSLKQCCLTSTLVLMQILMESLWTSTIYHSWQLQGFARILEHEVISKQLACSQGKETHGDCDLSKHFCTF